MPFPEFKDYNSLKEKSVDWNFDQSEYDFLKRDMDTEQLYQKLWQVYQAWLQVCGCI